MPGDELKSNITSNYNKKNIESQKAKNKTASIMQRGPTDIPSSCNNTSLEKKRAEN